MAPKKQASHFSVFHLDVTCRTLQEFSRMALVSFVEFACKTHYIIWEENTADVSKFSKIVQRDLTFILNVSLEPSIHFA